MTKEYISKEFFEKVLKQTEDAVKQKSVEFCDEVSDMLIQKIDKESTDGQTCVDVDNLDYIEPYMVLGAEMAITSLIDVGFIVNYYRNSDIDSENIDRIIINWEYAS